LPNSSRNSIACLLLILLWGPAYQATAATPARLLEKFPTTRLVVMPRNGPCVLFDVWVAAAPAERSRGLMFIESLEEYEGMLFIYQQPAQIAMWMKNTLIPLDMLFIRSDLSIATIAGNTVPLSEDSIYSGEDVQVVLELPGGSAERWNFQPDDSVWLIDRQPSGPRITL